MSKAKQPRMSLDQATRWARYEQRKRELADAIRAGRVKADEYERRLRAIAAECGV
jgi:hypothetical protein